MSAVYAIHTKKVVIGTWDIRGSNMAVLEFIKSKLIEYGYTILKVEFSD